MRTLRETVSLPPPLFEHHQLEIGESGGGQGRNFSGLWTRDSVGTSAGGVVARKTVPAGKSVIDPLQDNISLRTIA